MCKLMNTRYYKPEKIDRGKSSKRISYMGGIQNLLDKRYMTKYRESQNWLKTLPML